MNALKCCFFITEISLLISGWKIRRTNGVEIALLSKSARASRGMAIRSLRLPSIGIDVTSHRSIPMITRPHIRAIGSDRIGLTPMALVSANHIDVVAMADVIKIVMP
jgi:hypothetical protein